MGDIQKIRNVCIIAHIDHGKSTLADRFLELTETIPKSQIRKQHLDSMELERERGITIKLQPVRMHWKDYEINLIDTPGHVDFSYEVSRSLAACEGAILLVDAVSGPQAQTYANLFLAQKSGLTIIPAVNKIDLPAAGTGEVVSELSLILDCESEDIYPISAKTGEGVEKLLDAVLDKISAPSGDPKKPFRSLIFDARYDEFQGVIAYVRVVDGEISTKENIHIIGSKTDAEITSLGYFAPDSRVSDKLACGQVGFIGTGLKDLSLCRAGDTLAREKDLKPLPGYETVKPMVYAGLFAREGEEFAKLQRALEELAMQDASLVFNHERSPVLGRGFRCGFLGLLHLEIIQERIKREYKIDPIITTPSVAYRLVMRDGIEKIITSPIELEGDAKLIEIQEPWVSADFYAPKYTTGTLMKLLQNFRGLYKNTSYQGEDRIILSGELPLSSIVTDFYDKLKSATSGYASMNYDYIGFRAADLVRLDILVAAERVDALSRIIPRNETFKEGKRTVQQLKTLIPKHQFPISLQAAIGGNIIARETISALRKDVTAKLYGGDVTRKKKLLKKQRIGKKELAKNAKVHIPTSAYLGILKRANA